MSQKINLKEIERKAYTSYHQDGLWDLYLGLLLAVMSISDLLFGNIESTLWRYAMYAVVIGLVYLIFWAGKKFITVPRMGLVKFGPARKVRQKKTAAIITISVLAGVIAMVLLLAVKSDPSGWEAVLEGRGLFAAGLGVWIAFIFSLGAYFMNFARLYVYGVFFALGFSGAILLDSPIMFFVAGCLILLPGLVIFIRFLRDYPQPA